MARFTSATLLLIATLYGVNQSMANGWAASFHGKYAPIYVQRMYMFMCFAAISLAGFVTALLWGRTKTILRWRNKKALPERSAFSPN